MTTSAFSNLNSITGLTCWPAEHNETKSHPELKVVSAPSSSSGCTFNSLSCPSQTAATTYTKPLAGSSYASLIREPDHLESGEKIKRPMNAFMVWSQERRAQIASSESKMHNSQISKELGAEWRKMDADKKAPYIKKAKDLRDELLRQHPNYVYRPKRKPRLASKNANHSINQASTSVLKQSERSFNNRIPTAAHLLLASKHSLQQQSLLLAYQTQLAAAIFKASQQGKEILAVTKQCPTLQLPTSNNVNDISYVSLRNSVLPELLFPENFLPSVAMNPLLLSKFTQPQIPPLSVANVNSQ